MLPEVSCCEINRIFHEMSFRPCIDYLKGIDVQYCEMARWCVDYNIINFEDNKSHFGFVVRVTKYDRDRICFTGAWLHNPLRLIGVISELKQNINK